jgi:hypothetical protein
MEHQLSPRRSKAATRRKARQSTGSTPRTAGPSRSGSVRTTLVPQIVTFGILAFGTTAFAGGAKGIIAPPPSVTGVLLYFLAAVTFFVLGACMWFVLSIFTDQRFMRSDPGTQVKVAREALAPVLEILGLLHKPSAKAASAS